MAKKKQNILREPSEIRFKKELKALTKEDKGKKPPNWLLSPQAVKLFILGGKTKSGQEIRPKYFGHARIVELAIATLATERALFLIGVPGTAKTWLSENLAAAISGTSRLIVQGNAGTHEENLTYGWNYAELLSHGPSEKAVVNSPILNAMQQGKIARIEELTRMSADVQDSLIMLLSEKSLPIPELGGNLQAHEGFNLIATANDKDRGIHSLSSALQRRFNTVYMPLPATMDEEIKIVKQGIEDFVVKWDLQAPENTLETIENVLTVFREMREGRTLKGDRVIKQPSATLSTAEAISTINSAISLSSHFGDGKIKMTQLVDTIIRSVIKDREKDLPIWKEYLYNILQNKEDKADLFAAASEVTDTYYNS